MVEVASTLLSTPMSWDMSTMTCGLESAEGVALDVVPGWSSLIFSARLAGALNDGVLGFQILLGSLLLRLEAIYLALSKELDRSLRWQSVLDGIFRNLHATRTSNGVLW